MKFIRPEKKCVLFFFSERVRPLTFFAPQQGSTYYRAHQGKQAIATIIAASAATKSTHACPMVRSLLTVMMSDDDDGIYNRHEDNQGFQASIYHFSKKEFMRVI
jgi:hypothetical protein